MQSTLSIAYSYTFNANLKMPPRDSLTLFYKREERNRARRCFQKSAKVEAEKFRSKQRRLRLISTQGLNYYYILLPLCPLRKWVSDPYKVTCRVVFIYFSF